MSARRPIIVEWERDGIRPLLVRASSERCDFLVNEVKYFLREAVTPPAKVRADGKEKLKRASDEGLRGSPEDRQWRRHGEKIKPDYAKGLN
ncbi:hypothetical protein EVAR_36421_1 [Eumeta japonica]|uniref:Uncharacterized protein n=1 Tax=Eumeta variegata TaxID=151549 RepID=A0A4C1VSA0_EUMVA|nr:hypothetical protein EVAR_36421_1 [Eumeta japonica]